MMTAKQQGGAEAAAAGAIKVAGLTLGWWVVVIILFVMSLAPLYNHPDKTPWDEDDDPDWRPPTLDLTDEEIEVQRYQEFLLSKDMPRRMAATKEHQWYLNYDDEDTDEEEERYAEHERQGVKAKRLALRVRQRPEVGLAPTRQQKYGQVWRHGRWHDE